MTTSKNKPMTIARSLIQLMVLGAVLWAGFSHADTPDNVIRLSEPVTSDEQSETFGSVLPVDATVMQLADVMRQPLQHVDQTIVVRTRVDQVCQKKGCFFIAQDDEALVRVSFKDYAFFVPTDVAGKTVTLSGELVQREMTEKEAAHYASDLAAGSDHQSGSAMEAGLTFEIVATSVQVPRG